MIHLKHLFNEQFFNKNELVNDKDLIAAVDKFIPKDIPTGDNRLKNYFYQHQNEIDKIIQNFVDTRGTSNAMPVSYGNTIQAFSEIYAKRIQGIDLEEDAVNERTNDPTFSKKEALQLLKDMASGAKNYREDIAYLGYLTRDAWGEYGKELTDLYNAFEELEDALNQQDNVHIKSYYKVIMSIVARMEELDGYKNEQSTRQFKDTGNPDWQHKDSGNEFPVPGELITNRFGEPEEDVNEQTSDDQTKEDIINTLSGLHNESGLEFHEWIIDQGFDALEATASKKLIGQWLDAKKQKKSIIPKLDDKAKAYGIAMGKYIETELSNSERSNLLRVGKSITRVE